MVHAQNIEIHSHENVTMCVMIYAFVHWYIVPTLPKKTHDTITRKCTICDILLLHEISITPALGKPAQQYVWVPVVSLK